jgi:MFS family permease
VRSIIAGIMLAMFLSALEQTIIAPALPTIGLRLGDIEDLSWVAGAYLLSATAVTPLFGKLSDIHGRRSIMLTGVMVFIIGSVACALAPTLWALIAARALQGIGGGSILPTASHHCGSDVARAGATRPTRRDTMIASHRSAARGFLLITCTGR